MKEELLKAIENDDLESMILVLEWNSTDHAGTAKAKDKRLAIKALLTAFHGRESELFNRAVFLSEHASATAKEIGAVLIAEAYMADPETANETLAILSQNDNWEVREWAASAMGHVLSQWFHAFYPVIQSWTMSSSPMLKRACSLAAMYAGKTKNEKWGNSLLDLLERMLEEEDEYVKKNLGPFAIGDGLLSYYPEIVLPKLEQWADHPNQNVRWNVAMAFTASVSLPFHTDYAHVLQKLENDEHPAVKRAAQKAKKNYIKKHPIS